MCVSSNDVFTASELDTDEETARAATFPGATTDVRSGTSAHHDSCSGATRRSTARSIIVTMPYDTVAISVMTTTHDHSVA